MRYETLRGLAFGALHRVDLRIPVVGAFFRVAFVGAGGRACGDLAPAIDEGFLGGTAGKADAELDAEHQGSMAIAIVANPEFAARRLMEDFEGLAMTDFARDAGVGELFLNVGDFAVV